jgi:hypothetical protein
VQNANDTIIVSKLCCPFCWELVDILRDETNRFKVRGRHPTPFPVELPAYLSRQVLREIITRFEEFLYDAILLMMTSQERTRAPSRQSISNSSTGSQKDKPTISAFKKDGKADFMSFPATFYDSDEPDHQLDGVPDEEVLDEELDDNSYYFAKDKANQATSTPSLPADTCSPGLPCPPDRG